MAAKARSSAVRSRRRRPSKGRLAAQWSLTTALLLGLVAALAGFVFAGSEAKIAAGVRIAGVKVGGLAPDEAQALLERRAANLRNVPVEFHAGHRRWRLTPARLGVEADWRAAIDAAEREGRGVGPFRGLRRIQVRVFGADIAPPTKVYEPVLQYELRAFARAIDQPHRESAIVLRAKRPVIVAGQTGRLLDREAAASVVVRALASLTRAPVGLPVRVDRPRVTPEALEPALRQTRLALSAPVMLSLGPTRWRLRPKLIARILALPSEGRTELRVAGPGATRWFTRFASRVDRPPVDANWAIASSGVRVIPAKPGRALNVPSTARAILRAALSTTNRRAAVPVETARPKLTTAEARGMRIKGLVGGYETVYGGDPNRLHNVRLVARLIDKTLIPPGGTFSFNQTTGERTADKGFLEAPVIINGELQNGLGGGVCQVSTTVFNAAYGAGLKIVSRTNHALYISHYPLGRDATVNYPDIDLRFVNDTGGWLLLRAFVGSSSLYIGLYGTPQGRRVETKTEELVVTGPAPVKRIFDPELEAGRKIVVEQGEPSRATSVRRRVYDADGDLLYENVWYSSYRGEKKIIRVGTKPKPPPKTVDPKPDEEPPAEEDDPVTTTTTTRP